MSEWDDAIDEKSRTIFRNQMARHSKVVSVVDESPFVSMVKLVRGGTLRVWLCNVYALTSSDVQAILDVDPAIEAIVVVSVWNSVSEQGRLEAAKNEVGAFQLGDFMGALNFSGAGFYEYLSPSERERRSREESQRPFRHRRRVDD